MDKTTEYLNSKAQEFLNNIRHFETRYANDGERIEQLQYDIFKIKKDNGEEGFEEAKPKIQEFVDKHYWMFFLEQSIKHELVKAKEVLTMADVLEIELDLSDEDKKAADEIRNHSSILFVASKTEDGEPTATLADIPGKEALNQAIENRKSNDMDLRGVYDGVQITQ